VKLLVIDTALAACQVALAEGSRLVAGASEGMARGHQERLATMTAEVMAKAGWAFTHLDRIAVTIGPGSFTGLRVGLAFAKGLRFATGGALAGIGSLAALAASAESSRAAGVVDARRGQVYLQALEAGRPLMAPDVLPLPLAAARLAELGGAMEAVGPGAALLADFLGPAHVYDRPAPSLAALVRLAIAAEPASDLRPLYLRAPDARLMPP
jgi:tRNA threonylcarbamoyladenosine biosynthesis protein TsaB